MLRNTKYAPQIDVVVWSISFLSLSFKHSEVNYENN